MANAFSRALDVTFWRWHSCVPVPVPVRWRLRSASIPRPQISRYLYGHALILTADEIDSHNTFGSPGVVAPAEFTGFRMQPEGLAITLPAKSVLMMEIE